MKKINVAELIRNYGKSTDRYYVTVTGEMHEVSVSLREDFPIEVCDARDNKFLGELTEWGGIYPNRPDCECVLYPSASERDWVTWAVERQAEIVSQLHPGQKVLARDYGDEVWSLTTYSHYVSEDFYPYKCSNKFYNICISYDGHEHLVGTKLGSGTKGPHQEVNKKGLKPGTLVLVRNTLETDGRPWMATMYSHINSDAYGAKEKYAYVCCGYNYRYCIPLKGNEKYVGTTVNPEWLSKQD